jgi:hypothetical protein
MYRLRPVLFFAAFLCVQGEDIPREQLILARVQAHMSDLLKRLPNYTCLQTIERTERSQNGKTKLIDVIRMEVALVDGKELFAWPGSKKFDDTSISDMVKGGAIGNGNFALHAKAVFQSRSPRFQFAGEHVREGGRNAYKWDFVVPENLSGYQIGNFVDHAITGYHGSFWADTTTLDVMRLEVYADDIPQLLKIETAADAVDYQSVKLGQEEFLLPARSELTLTNAGGLQHRNRTTFSGCRQYTGESKISFDDAIGGEQTREPDRTMQLPARLRLEVALDTPIEEEHSAIGDHVLAILKRPVKLGSGLVAPKGALVHGRVTHLRQQQNRLAGWAVGLTFFEMEWQNTRAELRAKLLDTPALSMRAAVSSQYRVAVDDAARENGIFFVPGARLRVPRGLLMYWETEPLEAEDKQ